VERSDYLLLCTVYKISHLLTYTTGKMHTIRKLCRKCYFDFESLLREDVLGIGLWLVTFTEVEL